MGKKLIKNLITFEKLFGWGFIKKLNLHINLEISLLPKSGVNDDK